MHFTLEIKCVTENVMCNCVWRTTWKVVIILFFLYDSHRHSQTKNKNQAKKKSNFIYPPRANQLIYFIYKYTYY